MDTLYSNGCKYSIFASTDKNKEVLEKYIEVWNGIKNHIETINYGNPIKYKKDLTKIRFDTNDDFQKSVFQNDSKCYPQIHIRECEYEL